MQINPVTGHINGHREQKQKGVFGVKMRQNGAQTHRATSIGQLVQNCTKFRTLIKVPFAIQKTLKSIYLHKKIALLPSSVSIERIQKRRNHITNTGNHIIRGHKIERDQG